MQTEMEKIVIDVFNDFQLYMRIALLDALEKIIGFDETKGILRVALKRYFEQFLKKYPLIKQFNSIIEAISAAKPIFEGALSRYFGAKVEVTVESPKRIFFRIYGCQLTKMGIEQKLLCTSDSLLVPEVAAKILFNQDAQAKLNKCLTKRDPYM